jgi:hypothetical protein
VKGAAKQLAAGEATDRALSVRVAIDTWDVARRATRRLMALADRSMVVSVLKDGDMRIEKQCNVWLNGYERGIQ